MPLILMSVNYAVRQSGKDSQARAAAVKWQRLTQRRGKSQTHVELTYGGRVLNEE